MTQKPEVSREGNVPEEWVTMPTHNTPVTFEVEVVEDDIYTVDLTGSICDDGIQVAREALLEVIENKANKIAVRMSHVDYISSSGIGMLVSVLKKCHQNRIDFALCELSEDIAELFALTRLDQVFTIASTLNSWRKTLA